MIISSHGFVDMLSGLNNTLARWFLQFHQQPTPSAPAKRDGPFHRHHHRHVHGHRL